MNCDRLFEELEALFPEYMDILEQACLLESPTADKAAVDAEIERMKRLASMGGFIPCPDHRLMPGSKFELVQYYAEEIKKIQL